MRKLVVTMLMLMGLLVVVSGCKKETPTSEERKQTRENVDYQRIELASPQQLQLIQVVQSPGNYIRMKGFAIRSQYHKRAYYVSTKIYGPGIEDGVTGVWFITGDKSEPGIIQNVDGTARVFTSDLPYGGDTKSGASMFDDDAGTVKEYTKQNL